MQELFVDSFQFNIRTERVVTEAATTTHKYFVGAI